VSEPGSDRVTEVVVENGTFNRSVQGEDDQAELRTVDVTPTPPAPVFSETLRTVTTVCHTSCEVKNCVRTSRSALEEDVAEVDEVCVDRTAVVVSFAAAQVRPALRATTPSSAWIRISR
jgi:hypothetical protein